MNRVNDYVDRIVHGRARFFPVPPFLSDELRTRAHWSVDEAGVRRALERSQQIRSSDSLQVPNMPRVTPGPRPAPIDSGVQPRKP